MTNKLSRRFASGLAVFAVALSAVALAPAESAGAWAWSGSATLQGTAHCSIVKATYVWVEASNGERGWATNGAGRYRFDFRRVPSSGMRVRINYGNGAGNCTDTITLRRPNVGTSATVNVIKIVPNA